MEAVAQFRFLRYEILNASIEIDEPGKISPKLEVEFNNVKDLSKEELFILGIEILIKDETGNLKIKVFAKGYFKFMNDCPENRKDDFMNINAPAILFPYIRAYISTLTALSGINPIILPTLNLSERKTKLK